MPIHIFDTDSLPNGGELITANCGKSAVYAHLPDTISEKDTRLCPRCLEAHKNHRNTNTETRFSVLVNE